jgi:hypothetical protein
LRLRAPRGKQISSAACAHSGRDDFIFRREVSMPKPNYAFAKRQRELAKKQKKEAKQRERDAAKNPAEATPGEGSTPPQNENQGG